MKTIFILSTILLVSAIVSNYVIQYVFNFINYLNQL